MESRPKKCEKCVVWLTGGERVVVSPEEFMELLKTGSVEKFVVLGC